jgi:hypothetical protein
MGLGDRFLDTEVSARAANIIRSATQIRSPAPTFLAGGRSIHFLKFDCINALPHRT